MENLEQLTQGSPEWELWRKKGIGSSDVAAVLGVSPYKTAYRLWMEKSGLIEPEDLSLNFVVHRGTALEPEARALVNKQLQKSFEPRLFLSSQYDWARYSSDGVCGNEIIEVKCPMESNHQKAISGEVPATYIPQVQYGLMVSGASKCHYVSYSPDHEKSLVTIEVFPDLDFHRLIVEECEKFWTCVLTGTPPPLTNKDKVLVNDNNFGLLVERYLEAKNELLIAEKKFDAIELEIKEYAEKTKNLNIYGFGVSMQKVVKKGTIDYSKIESLSGVDMENYRRPSSSYWTVKIDKSHLVG